MSDIQLTGDQEGRFARYGSQNAGKDDDFCRDLRESPE
jgi:hypothetical protein